MSEAAAWADDELSEGERSRGIMMSETDDELSEGEKSEASETESYPAELKCSVCLEVYTNWDIRLMNRANDKLTSELKIEKYYFAFSSATDNDEMRSHVLRSMLGATDRMCSTEY